MNCTQGVSGESNVKAPLDAIFFFFLLFLLKLGLTTNDQYQGDFNAGRNDAMSVDLRRSRSLSQDLRPRVSFNRDVHVKRYGGKKPLGRIDEEDSEINGMRGRRGKADGTDYNSRRNSVDVDNNTSSISSTTMNNSRKQKENQSFGQRLRSLFGGGSGGGSKKKQNVTTSTNTETTSTNSDSLRSRYKEYRGEVGLFDFFW
uniref:Uncharacterized protein n=1 Tax=Rhodnius prolixus TaxID=13249 RepID=T1I0E7_RHOPR